MKLVNKYRGLSYAISFVLCITLFASCSGSDDDNPDFSTSEDGNLKYQGLIDDLKNTSWMLSRTNKTNIISNYLQSWKNSVITFSSDRYSSSSDAWRLRISGPGYNVTNGYWTISDKGQLQCISSFNLGGGNGISSSQAGEFMNIFGSMVDVDIEITPSSLTLNDGDTYWIFSKVTYLGMGDDSSSDNWNNNSNDYEVPEIGLEDYTVYSNSITVYYRIYNQNSAKVTSAKGYYGTSSPSKSVSGSVSGSLITIRFTGLSNGTTYYIKCSATGKGGTSTSETTRLMTTN